MTKTKMNLTAMLILLTAVPAEAQIRVNQVGMYPDQEKTIVIEGKAKASQVHITKAGSSKTAVKARVLRNSVSPWSGKTRTVMDFSKLTEPGSYQIRYGRHTASFSIREGALGDVTRGALKAFYLTRTGVPTESRYAGPYARPTGHPDIQVFVHPSAASKGRPAGSTISSPYGWYDAGDYNKYIVNSAFSIGIILCSYQQNSSYYDAMSADIPESANQTADVLDEMLFNLRWMLTMQDPYDGGVYHKLTTPSFEGFIMPAQCKQKRYVVKKTVTAALDFAAVMAQAARILKDNKDYPDFSQQASRAALAAYGWAERHPQDFYHQQQLKDPAVSTGAYDDNNAEDEWYWAATELFLLTGDETFAEEAERHMPKQFAVPTWGNVGALATLEWLGKKDGSPLLPSLRKGLLDYCEAMLATTEASSFQTPSGNTAREYGWGCLAETFCAKGMILLTAYRLTGDRRYLVGAQQNADYVLGRNATGYCYVTGFGTKSPMHPHHRLSEADGVEAPYPGLLVGGPNPGQQDNGDGSIKYPSRQPDESYIDVMQSYASNEIAINWNASLLALLAGLEAVTTAQ